MIILPHARGSLAICDQLALDLQFATDKTLTARIGPTPVLTRASNATFIGSDGLIQSAAAGVARFDHDPANPSVCRGLLLEESRTNLLYPSSIAAPQLVTQTRTLLLSNTYILSFYGAGQVVVSGNKFTTTTVTGIGAYPSRKTFAFTVPGSGTGIFTFAVSGTVQYAQLEQSGTAGTLLTGAATSFIETTGGSAIRATDVCSIAGADFTSFWNRFAGTCVVGVGSSGASTHNAHTVYLGTSAGVGPTTIFISTPKGETNINFIENSGSQTVRIVTGATYPIKIGLAYAINDYQSSYSGLLGGSDTDSGGTIPDCTSLRIGYSATSTFGSTHIQFVRYYKKRLPNAKLQAITA